MKTGSLVSSEKILNIYPKNKCNKNHTKGIRDLDQDSRPVRSGWDREVEVCSSSKVL